MVRNVPPKQAHALQNDEGFHHVDVRSEQEFAMGHPEGAVNVPIFRPGPGGMMPNPEFLQVMQRLFEPGTHLLLSCASGMRSMRACQLLAAAGYKHVVNLEGGFNGSRNPLGMVQVQGWASCGLPVSKLVDGVDYASVRARASGGS